MKTIFCLIPILFCIGCSTWPMFKRGPVEAAPSTEASNEYYSPASPEAKATIRNLEAKLENKREKEQYSKVLPLLKNEAERIEFLKLNSMEERQTWMNNKKIWTRPRAVNDGLTEMVSTGDIALGMPQDLVKKAWGEPQVTEVSGNPLYKNERWKYLKYTSTPDGFKPEKRTVYFEGGKVVGWETD